MSARNTAVSQVRHCDDCHRSRPLTVRAVDANREAVVYWCRACEAMTQHVR